MRVEDRGRRRSVTGVAIGVVGASLAFAGTAAAAAQPASLAVNAACYVTVSAKNRPEMTITGNGYEPGDTVLVTDTTGEVDVQTTANSAGAISVTTKAPVPELTKPGEKADTITATDYALSGAEIQGTTTTDLTVLAAEFGKTHRAPGLGAYREKTTWRFSGFPTGKLIWGHYFLGKKLVARQAFGRATGPCGILTTRKRILPVSPRGRDYDLYVESAKKYSKGAVPRVPVKLRLITV